MMFLPQSWCGIHHKSWRSVFHARRWHRIVYRFRWRDVRHHRIWCGRHSGHTPWVLAQQAHRWRWSDVFLTGACSPLDTVQKLAQRDSTAGAGAVYFSFGAGAACTVGSDAVRCCSDILHHTAGHGAVQDAVDIDGD